MTVTDIRQNVCNAAPSISLPSETAGPSRLARWMLLAFILGILVPIWIRVGSLLLMPHRIVLLVLFIPVFFMLFTGKAGKVRLFDILMLASTLWAVLSLAVNGTILGASLPQQMGVYLLESLGAYMLARVTIRTAADFAFFTKVFFIALLVLVPFGVVESLIGRPLLLEAIPQSVKINNAPPRWGLRRAQGVFAHPILFGVFCSAGFGLFWYAMRSKLTRGGGSVMAFAGTFVSLSSGALMSVVMQLSFMVWDGVMKSVRHRWRIFSSLAAMAYITVDLLSNRNPFHVLVSYGTFNSGSAYNRILIWRHGTRNVWDNPWFGLGADVTLWVRPSWMSSSADNFWLLGAMQYGLPAFIFLAVALFMILRGISTAPLKDTHSMDLRAGYLTAVGGLILAGGTVHYWHGVMAFIFFFFGAGVWAIVQGQTSDTQEGEADIASDGGGRTQVHVYTRQTARHHRENKGF